MPRPYKTRVRCIVVDKDGVGAYRCFSGDASADFPLSMDRGSIVKAMARLLGVRLDEVESYFQCPFYADTWDGKRCVLMPPEQWRAEGAEYRGYCNNAPWDCPVYWRIGGLRREGGRLMPEATEDSNS